MKLEQRRNYARATRGGWTWWASTGGSITSYTPSPQHATPSPTRGSPSFEEGSCFRGKIRDNVSYLESMKDYNNLIKNFNYKREKIFKLKSLVYLRLSSLRGSGKWILFFVDRVNVKLFGKSSPWITDGVIHLLSNGISKGLGQILVLIKLVEEFNSFSGLLSWKSWSNSPFLVRLIKTPTQYSNQNFRLQ